MENVGLIFKIFIALVNCLAVSFISFIVIRIYDRMIRRIDAMSDYLLLLGNSISNLKHKNDVIYLNQLIAMKKDMIEKEQYEGIALVESAIEQERKKISEFMEMMKLKEDQQRGKEKRVK